VKCLCPFAWHKRGRQPITSPPSSADLRPRCSTNLRLAIREDGSCEHTPPGSAPPTARSPASCSSTRRSTRPARRQAGVQLTKRSRSGRWTEWKHPRGRRRWHRMAHAGNEL